MCGISIVINTRGKVPSALIRAVNDKVAHRGPDDEGFHEGENFAFGHRRLSILDLSQAGHQPMSKGNHLITYNGEIYNYIEIREELKEKGYLFQSDSDTEVILAAYDAWGTDSFARLNGMWAFAIHDEKKKEIIFSRDHFGIKPLYYTSVSGYFMAGSEIKQFTAFEGFIPVLNKAVAVNFLISGWLNYSEQTFFEGVQELKAGHYLRYDLGNHIFEIKKWYDLEEASVKINDSYAMAVARVRQLFLDSVRIRMRSDVRVGSCLSGGVDSSSIVTIIHSEKLGNDDFATITSCYQDKRYDEQQYSDTVSTQTGFRSEKVYPDINHLLDKGELDKIIYHQDQPFSGASHYSEFNVFRKAHENGITVMQDGQGADEFLCGYGEFYIARLITLMKKISWAKAVALIRAKATHRHHSFASELKSVIRTLLIYPLISKVKNFLRKESYPWLSATWKIIASDQKLDFTKPTVRALSIQEIEVSSIPYQLHSEDRNSMLFSIESRLPFLDHRLVEYCIGLPDDFKIKDGYTKAVLRDAINELPELISKRKDKMGFVAPDPEWMLQNRDRVRKVLEDSVLSSPIFSSELLTRFDKFVNGELGYEPVYFRAMTLSRFCELFKMKII